MEQHVTMQSSQWHHVIYSNDIPAQSQTHRGRKGLGGLIGMLQHISRISRLWDFCPEWPTASIGYNLNGIMQICQLVCSLGNKPMTLTLTMTLVCEGDLFSWCSVYPEASPGIYGSPWSCLLMYKNTHPSGNSNPCHFECNASLVRTSIFEEFILTAVGFFTDYRLWLTD